MFSDFRKLHIWKRSHELALSIYKLSNGFPKSELYGLSSQLRRAASSVPANIVEGYSRNSTKQYINFLNIAKGSLAETFYFLLLAYDLNYLSKEEYINLEKEYQEITKMITSAIYSLKNKQIPLKP